MHTFQQELADFKGTIYLIYKLLEIYKQFTNEILQHFTIIFIMEITNNLLQSQ